MECRHLLLYGVDRSGLFKSIRELGGMGWQRAEPSTNLV